jgi:hypothetical protein
MTSIVRVPLDVDAITARAEAAPGGPWLAFSDSLWIPWHADAAPCSPWDHGRYIAVRDGDWHGDEDPPAELWTFLADARDDVLSLAAEVRRLRTALTAQAGCTSDPAPVPRGWLPTRLLAYARARRALDEDAIRDYRDGVTWETPEFLRLNRAVADAETGVPPWMQTLTDWAIERKLRYWKHVRDNATTADYDRPLPVALTPKALAALAASGQRPTG